VSEKVRYDKGQRDVERTVGNKAGVRCHLSSDDRECIIERWHCS
jgi:hypothetical protein